MRKEHEIWKLLNNLATWDFAYGRETQILKWVLGLEGSDEYLSEAEAEEIAKNKLAEMLGI